MGSGVEVELAWPTGWLGLGSLVEPKPDPPPRYRIPEYILF